MMWVNETSFRFDKTEQNLAIYFMSARFWTVQSGSLEQQLNLREEPVFCKKDFSFERIGSRNSTKMLLEDFENRPVQKENVNLQHPEEILFVSSSSLSFGSYKNTFRQWSSGNNFLQTATPAAMGITFDEAASSFISVKPTSEGSYY